MAKKKSKKKNLLSQYGNFAILIFTVAVIVAFFLQNAKITSEWFGVLGEFSGMQLAFGYSEKVASISVAVLDFSIMALLAYLLPVAGLVLTFLFKDGGFIINIVTLACFVVGAVLLFLIPSFAIVGGQAVEGLSLGYGAIIGAVASALSALTVLGKSLSK